MTIKDFCKLIDGRVHVRVFDRFGHAGTFEAKNLLNFFDGYRYIIEIKPTAANLIDITIDCR